MEQMILSSRTLRAKVRNEPYLAFSFPAEDGTRYYARKLFERETELASNVYG